MKENINFEDQSNSNQEFDAIFKGAQNLNGKRNYALAILFTIFLGAFTYLTFPIYSFKYASSISFMMIITIVYAFLLFKDKKKPLLLIPIFFTIYIILVVMSSPIVRSQDYYDLIGEVNQVNYNETPPNIDNEMVPVVDEQLARTLGDKVLGSDIGLGSQYTVGEYYLINTNDDLVWVAPLEPRSFIKWFQNQEGSPGYVYVSATDPNDVRLVQEINGEPINLKYTNESYFASNIYRHAYFANNMTRGLTDFSFEIDDEGNPYWVITTYAPQVGISGYDATGAVIIDAQTGETTTYNSIEEIPSWAERIQPTSFITQQVNYWGYYKNGWLNTVLGQKEMITTTNGFSYVMIDNEPYYYTGLTSVTNDQSTVGFILVNMRTKETTFYPITGATEEAAMNSAEGQVQQFGYQATFPVLVNEFGKATYFMTLKDADGLLKQYAYVSVENYNIVGVGNTKEEAKSNYYNSLKSSGTVNSSNIETNVTTGVVERINYIEGTYYIKLVGSDALYKASADISPILPYTNIGDTVTIEASSDSSTYVETLTFKNDTLE
jgi:hypothetical protein